MFWIVGLIINAAAWTYHALLLLATWENRRFACSRISNFVPGVAAWQRVGLIVPCKGAEHGLAENLTRFLKQDYPHYHVTFVVESTDDPAHGIAQQVVLASKPGRARVITAGQGGGTGQKIHNLRAAIESQADDINVFAFADSDVRPEPDWLRALVFGLTKSDHGAITGYRWFVPERNTLANMLLYSFNSATAALYGPGGHSLVWGGAWAIRREVLEQTAVVDAWQGTLSDDLVVSRALRLSRLKIVFEPRSMVASHVDTDLTSLSEFVRRQFLIGRCYATRTWLLSWGALTLSLVALWGSVALFGWQSLRGQGASWWLLANVIGLYGVSSVRAWLRQDLTRFYLPTAHDRLAAARRFDIWLSPVAGLLLWCGYAASCFGSSIVWRGIGYFIGPGGRILLLGRRLPQQTNSNQQQESETQIRRAA